MTTTGYQFGHSTIIGDPTADWSHASSYLANLNKEHLDATGGDLAEDQGFRQRLVEARGVDDLTEDDFALSKDLAEADGVDISYFPGGNNYQASLVSATNPLGLPGDLWAAVSDPSEGALVAALVRVTNEGDLEAKWPNGHDWEPLTDPSVLSDFDYVGVNPEAVQLFQNYDRDNTLGVIGSYPMSDLGPFPTQEQMSIPMSKEIPEPRSEDDEYWENSGETHGAKSVSPVVASVVVVGAEDLPEAIAAAVADPDIRWYVERRVAALGLEADLPWLEG